MHGLIGELVVGGTSDDATLQSLQRLVVHRGTERAR